MILVELLLADDVGYQWDNKNEDDLKGLLDETTGETYNMTHRELLKQEEEFIDLVNKGVEYFLIWFKTLFSCLTWQYIRSAMASLKCLLKTSVKSCSSSSESIVAFSSLIKLLSITLFLL